MNRKAQNMSIETLGKLVLAVLNAIGIIVFVISGITQNASAFNDTGSDVVGELTDKAEEASSGLVLS